jgi:hypothetical protein
LKAAFQIGLLVVLVSTGCNEASREQRVQYTWLGEQRSICFPDTITLLPKHSVQDSMLGRVEFTYCEGRHTVTSWTDDYHSPVDGGSFWLELDSLGKIYSHSTTWPGFGIIRSNSDSINDLIMMAIGVASRPGRYGRRYPLPPEPHIGTVQFTAADTVLN